MAAHSNALRFLLLSSSAIFSSPFWPPCIEWLQLPSDSGFFFRILARMWDRIDQSNRRPFSLFAYFPCCAPLRTRHICKFSRTVTWFRRTLEQHKNTDIFSVRYSVIKLTHAYLACDILVGSLHFVWVVYDRKCIVVTCVCVCVCVCVCLSVRGRMPTLLHGPGCNLEEW